MAVLGGKKPYWQRLRSIQPGNLIGLWRQNETTGTQATDSSLELNHGAYSNVTLANAAGPDGVLVPSFNGTTSHTNIYSVGFAADWVGTAGSVVIWGKVASSGIWTDGTADDLLHIGVDTSTNRIRFRKSATSNQLDWLLTAASTNKQVQKASVTTTGWFCMGMSWSQAADQMKAFYKELTGTWAQEGSTQTGLGAWSGSLGATFCPIGATNTNPTNLFNGWLGPVAVWKVALSDAEMQKAMTI